jgi:hypothetical protein
MTKVLAHGQGGIVFRAQVRGYWWFVDLSRKRDARDGWVRGREKSGCRGAPPSNIIDGADIGRGPGWAGLLEFVTGVTTCYGSCYGLLRLMLRPEPMLCGCAATMLRVLRLKTPLGRVPRLKALGVNRHTGMTKECPKHQWGSAGLGGVIALNQGRDVPPTTGLGIRRRGEL